MILKGAMTLKGFEYLLLVAGVNCVGRLSGFTKSDEEIPTREGQIRFWVDDFCVKNFVVLDDLPLDLPELVKTDPAYGLTNENAQEVIRRFNAQELGQSGTKDC